MSSPEFNKADVPLEDRLARYVDGKPVFIPRDGVDCEVFETSAVDSAIFASHATGGQMSLTSSTVIGTTRDTRHLKELRREEYKKRAQECGDGSCPFISKVPGCWRRNFVQLELDTSTQK